MLPRLTRLAALGLTATLLTGLGSVTPAFARPAAGHDAGPDAGHDAGHDAGRTAGVLAAREDDTREAAPTTKRLHDDVVEVHRSVATDHSVATSRRLAARPRIRFWPGRTIRYHETIPAAWDWSLQDAVNRWNGTGARLKLVKVTSPRRAQLKIRYGNTGGSDGVGTLGYAPGHNVVILSNRYKRVNELNPEQRAWVSRLFAHEIGHNLGYEHTRPTCSLMVPVFQFGTCGPLSTGKPGYHRCGYIDTALLRKHIRVYRGRAAAQPRNCLLAPLPPQLADVTVSGGGSTGPVTLRWRTVRPPAGARLRVAVWKASSCGAVPGSARSFQLAVTATTWVDPETGRGPWCYAVAVRNRYGGEQRPVVRQRTRYLPVPVQPDVSVRYDARREAYVATWEQVRGLDLWLAEAVDDSGACNLDPDDAYSLGHDREHLVYPWRAEECLVFYTVNELDDRSAPREVQVEVPMPTSTLSIGEITPPTSPDGTGFTVTVTGAGDERVGLETDFGACDPQEQVNLTDPEPLRTDVYGFDLPQEGRYCLYAATTDSLDRHGPVTMKAFTATFPPITARPAVGEVTATSDPYVYAVTAALPARTPESHVMAAEVLPGACPAAEAPGLQYYNRDDDRDGAVDLYVWDGDGPYCAFVTAINGTYDAAGDPRHGPVVLRTFTVSGTD